MSLPIFHVLMTFADKAACSGVDDWLHYCSKKCVMDLFLDSGAFSAKYSGKEIKIDDYINYVQDHKEKFTVYVNLDVIDDWRGTAEHQRIMEEAGLRPIPIIQYGAPLSEVQRIAENYDYAGIGSIKGIKDFKSRLAYTVTVMRKCREIRPAMRFHGFGITSHFLLTTLPWYSVDSASWKYAGIGGVARLFDPGAKRMVAFSRSDLKKNVRLYERLKGLGRLYDAPVPQFLLNNRKTAQAMMDACLKSFRLYGDYIRQIKQPEPFILYIASFEYHRGKKPGFLDYIFSDLQGVN